MVQIWVGRGRDKGTLSVDGHKLLRAKLGIMHVAIHLGLHGGPVWARNGNRRCPTQGGSLLQR
eukprot:6488951-Amphidinium_carterae.2